MRGGRRYRPSRTPSLVRAWGISFQVGYELVDGHGRRRAQLAQWRGEHVLLRTALELAERLGGLPVACDDEDPGVARIARQRLAQVPGGPANLGGDRAPGGLERALLAFADRHRHRRPEHLGTLPRRYGAVRREIDRQSRRRPP